MTPVVAGFWGAFFGAVALMALGSLLAFIRTRHRVPLRAALLHGRGAANHALFVCASRLRRCVPANVEMGDWSRTASCCWPASMKIRPGGSRSCCRWRSGRCGRCR
jgi:hypothetical protein